MSCLVGTEQQDHLKQNTFQSDFAMSFGPCKRELFKPFFVPYRHVLSLMFGIIFVPYNLFVL